ncbi:hypothetical protein C8A00DRAFT_29827 [Chaetomidium leptoderma]|uniref:Ubiquitin carrier protein n=1 Tax=Chaetomidium leptoderma TaxID=669021 RepID=A0AAN6VT16_9PEZI|nr:hypothetical protein C8A00DRAFT_29827 [Chaetomidium leptoderma]
MFSTVTIGHSLAKRFTEDPPQWKLPTTAYFLFLGDFLLFLPVLLIFGYTLQHVYPTLAAVEDPLPAYEALAMNDDGTPKADNDPIRTAQPGKPITSSIRATNRLIRSLGGWLSNFRGLGYSIVIGFFTLTALGVFSVVLPVRIAHLLALIALAPLSTTWTHIVITAPTPGKSFFQRIPSPRKVYLATWLPTILLWAAAHVSALLPELLDHVIGLQLRDRINGGRFRDEPLHGSDIAKILAVVGLSVALQALLVIPSHAALTRVQASLLPADQDTLVPFDRSFAGRVEPEVVTGKGFATFGAAIKTIPVASWVRIYLLRVKVFAVGMGVYALMGVIVAGQLLLVRRMCDGGENEDGEKVFKCY